MQLRKPNIPDLMFGLLHPLRHGFRRMAPDGRLNLLPHLIGALEITLALTMIATSAHAQERRIIGYVKAVSGDWFMEGKRPKKLVVYDYVLSGSRIRAGTPAAKYSYIQIELGNGSETKRICNRQGECGEPILLPNEVSPPANPPQPRPRKREANVIERTLINFLNHRPRYKPIMARTRRELPVQEAVVRLSDGQLDLREVFKNQEPGSLVFKLEAITDAESAANEKVIGPIRIEWNPDSPQPVAVATLSPGLFKLYLMDSDSAKAVPQQEAWILVAPQEKYRQMLPRFKNAMQHTASLEEGLEEEAAGILRAYLEALCLDENWCAQTEKRPPGQRKDR